MVILPSIEPMLEKMCSPTSMILANIVTILISVQTGSSNFEENTSHKLLWNFMTMTKFQILKLVKIARKLKSIVICDNHTWARGWGGVGCTPG